MGDAPPQGQQLAGILLPALDGLVASSSFRAHTDGYDYTFGCVSMKEDVTEMVEVKSAEFGGAR